MHLQIYIGSYERELEIELTSTNITQLSVVRIASTQTKPYLCPHSNVECNIFTNDFYFNKLSK